MAQQIVTKELAVEKLSQFQDKFKRGIKLNPRDFTLEIIPTRYNETYIQWQNKDRAGRQVHRQSLYRLLQQSEITQDIHVVTPVVQGTGKPGQIELLLEIDPYFADTHPGFQKLIEQFETYSFHLGYIPYHCRFLIEIFQQSPSFLQKGYIRAVFPSIKNLLRMKVVIPLGHSFIEDDTEFFRDLHRPSKSQPEVLDEQISNSHLELW